MQIRPATPDDHDAWLPLWQGYLAFYEVSLAPEVTEATWRRIIAPDGPIDCLVAVQADGALAGFATWLLHPNTWSDQPVCYLEDLFVSPAARGQGVATRLIEALAAMGRQNGWHRVYWHTDATNTRARAVYDRVARLTTRVRYDIDL